MLVLDVSLSTGESTGVDVNGNGVVGASGAPGSLPRHRRRRLDPRRGGRRRAPAPGGASIRASRGSAVVELRGGPAGDRRHDRARLARALGAHRGAAHQRLRARRARPRRRARARPLGQHAHGGGARPGDDRAARACGARSRSPNPKSSKVVLFLTDGLPTLPVRGSPSAENVRRRGARGGPRAARRHPGPHLRHRAGGALRARSRRSRWRTARAASSRRCATPSDIVAAMGEVSLANIESLTRAEPHDGPRRRRGHGSASTAPGPRARRARSRARTASRWLLARATARRRAARSCSQHAPDAALPEVPPALVGRPQRAAPRRDSQTLEAGGPRHRARAHGAGAPRAGARDRARSGARRRSAPPSSAASCASWAPSRARRRSHEIERDLPFSSPARLARAPRPRPWTSPAPSTPWSPSPTSHAGSGVIEATLTNRGDRALRDVRLLIEYVYHWPDEMHPGDDSPGARLVPRRRRARSHPARARQLRFAPPGGLPTAPGRFEPRDSTEAGSAFVATRAARALVERVDRVAEVEGAEAGEAGGAGHLLGQRGREARGCRGRRRPARRAPTTCRSSPTCRT